MLINQKQSELLRLLLHIEAVEGRDTLSLRTLAKTTTLSLTKVQTLIAQAEDDNLVVHTGNKQAPHYELTDTGKQAVLTMLASSMPTWIPNDNGQVSTAVILAAGETTDIDEPAALVPIDQDSLLKRNLKLLEQHGITNIIVVAGYKDSLIRTITDQFSSVTTVTVTDYKTSGTMSSLAQAAPLINDDFLLVEGDLLFDEGILDELQNTISANVISVAPLSGSGDEAFVDFNEENQLLQISKDIRQMNELSAEMIGISKISHGLFDLMLAAYKNNSNSWLNYEYLINRLARGIKVTCLVTDNLSWQDIDDQKHLKIAQTTTLTAIKRHEQSTQLKLAKDTIVSALNLPDNAVKDVAYAGGMTNTNYSAQVQLTDQAAWRECFVRIPGKGTNKLINRKTEQPNAKQASDLKFNVPTLYMDLDGVKITETVPGALTLSPRAMRLAENYRKAATLLRSVHDSSMTFENQFSFTTEWHHYEQSVRDLEQSFYPDYDSVRLQVLAALEKLETLGLDARPCHNDLVPENFIKGADARLYLIDWEYSGTNDPTWDLSALLNESQLTKEEENDFLATYAKGVPSEKLVLKVAIFKALQDILWSTWAIVKTASGVDFNEYGQSRYDRAQKELKRVLADD